ncbi:MAG: 30S ribosomal protein S16 [Candidatus Gracilibacteria bacterium]|nr:30S ribosomal protein S16 [Candidatus Gracilibacteria bacterium]
MLKIRLSRSGRKHVPFFHIVLTEHSQSAKHGYMKILGYYNATTKELKFDEADAAGFVKNGAQYSPTLVKILERSKK